MNALTHIWTYLLVCGLAIVLPPLQGLAQQNAGVSKTDRQQALKERDGQSDFDFHFGTWKTHVRRLLRPLAGSTTWVEYEGTSVVSKVWNGRASLFELDVEGPAGHIEGVGLRLYNPQSHQWSLNWANRNDGTMSQPMVGEFKNGRGDFFDQELFNDRAIYVRKAFSVSRLGRDYFRTS